SIEFARSRRARRLLADARQNELGVGQPQLALNLRGTRRSRQHGGYADGSLQDRFEGWSRGQQLSQLARIGSGSHGESLEGAQLAARDRSLDLKPGLSKLPAQLVEFRAVRGEQETTVQA